MSRRVGQIVIYAVVASLSLLGGAEPSSVRADERPTATEGDVGEVVKGDMLGLYRVPGAFLAEGPFPILELETIQFVDGSQIKEKGSRITFSLPAGNPLLGEVALTFRDPQRSAMGVTLRAPDGTPAILHFDYNADGSFNSGLLLANKNNLSYTFSKTSKGTYLIEAKTRDEIAPVEPTVGAQAPSATSNSNLAPQSVVPVAQLESFPGAPNVLLLDFDGHRTEGTSMNTESGYAVIVSQASGLSVAQQTYLWSRVSEFFKPFNINVTTKESVFESAPGAQRTRVVLSYTDWYNPRNRSTASGYAHLDSWGRANGMTPVFVFLHYAGDDYVQPLVITHESGHALGLHHDGRIVPREEYFAGHVRWGPLLGNPYYMHVSQWSKGEYSSANNGEDDINMILSNAGIAYRQDAVGDSRFTARTLTAPRQAGSVQYEGIIETRQDKDVFRIVTGKTKLSIEVISALPGLLHRGMLNISARLIDDKGSVIASASPQSDLPSSTSPGSSNLDAIFTPVAVAAGTYYLEVDGVGDRNPLVDGYSDYSSVGSYTVRVGGIVPNIATQTPTITPTPTQTNTPTPKNTKTPPPTLTAKPPATSTPKPTPQPSVAPTKAPTSAPTKPPTTAPPQKPPTPPTATPRYSSTPTGGVRPGPVPTRLTFANS